MSRTLTSEQVAQAARLFLSPSPQYCWDQIIDGVPVSFEGGRVETRNAVGTTFRGFRRVDQDRPGAKHMYDSYFRENKKSVLEDLAGVTGRDKLHDLADHWRREIVAKLDNVKPELLWSYGRTRKPIDLYVMNLTALAEELADARPRLVPLLFLPLDSQMFQKAIPESELRKHGLSSGSSFGDVKSEKTYLALQSGVSAHAEELGRSLGVTVHPIYLEMLWRDRVRGEGSNIFSASPMRGT